LARMGFHILGPFSYWVWRRSYPVFIPRKDTKERIARYIPECSFSTPTQTIKRAYVDTSSDLWIYVQTKAYDLAKHFRGKPALKRRIGSLWYLGCPRCERYLITSTEIVIFWRDPEAKALTIGPCRPSEGRLYVGRRGYYIGEVLNVFRDLYGVLYATVTGFKTIAEKGSERLVEVSEIPEIGWRRPLILEGVGAV
jgi:hypothetical protein